MDSDAGERTGDRNRLCDVLDGEGLRAAYRAVRTLTERLAAPLSAEDQLLQSMPSASPTKWHRAHTTWFFERFVLAPQGIDPVDPKNDFLWNSYYEAVGARHPRPQRGLLSRPSLSEVAHYREVVDARMDELLGRLAPDELAALTPVVLLGLAHEQQHQELILTDILHALAQSPLAPAYREAAPRVSGVAPGSASFTVFDGGLVEIGARPGHFSFDNEGPRHRVHLAPFALADRFVTVGEVRAFIADGGYRRPGPWLSEGWDWVRREHIAAPLYWDTSGEGARVRAMTLEGERELDDAEPACHLSFYEADAVARFLGARLPTEAEWEHAAPEEVSGHLLDLSRPLGPCVEDRPAYGTVWTWTRSAYAPYPGYRPGEGALGEYNGKFMINQVVLRGGSCLTPVGHVRRTYRNFWYPDTRFQMTGVRLARDVAP